MDVIGLLYSSDVGFVNVIKLWTDPQPCLFYNALLPNIPNASQLKRKLELKIMWTDNLCNRWTKLEKLYNLNPVQRLPNPLSHAVDAVCLSSTQGIFCGAVLGQLAQILIQQHSASSLSHAVDRGSHVLHTREFLRSAPWAVSSNSQLTVFGHYLVTCRWLRLACAPHEGDFLNSVEEDHLPIYNVVTFWQGEYTHNELFGKPCFGEKWWKKMIFDVVILGGFHSRKRFLGYNYTSVIYMRYEEIEGSNMKIGLIYRELETFTWKLFKIHLRLYFAILAFSAHSIGSCKKYIKDRALK